MSVIFLEKFFQFLFFWKHYIREKIVFFGSKLGYAYNRDENVVYYSQIRRHFISNFHLVCRLVTIFEAKFAVEALLNATK